MLTNAGCEAVQSTVLRWQTAPLTNRVGAEALL
jgi:hypothetical protein